MSDRTQWEAAVQEKKIESFYDTAMKGFHEYHQGYLNFGYWTKGGMTYVQAAENLVRQMCRRLGLNSESVLLDVGCGMGTQDTLIAREVKPKSIDALDVTWQHIERARERASRMGISKSELHFHHGTATKLPFPDASFTHLLSIEAVEFCNTREDFFKEAFRVLKSGGVLAFSDYALARQPKNVVDRFIIMAVRRIWKVPTVNIYGNEVFKEKLASAGFTNIQIENVGRLTIPGYYHESVRLKNFWAMWKIRGFFKGVLGGYLIDRGIYSVYRRGLCEYIIVRAQKPS